MDGGDEGLSARRPAAVVRDLQNAARERARRAQEPALGGRLDVAGEECRTAFGLQTQRQRGVVQREPAGIVGVEDPDAARVRILSAGAWLPDFARGVRVLHPDDTGGLSLNDSSLTLRLEHEGGAALLTGDIEAAAEGRLLRAPGMLASSLLKVPHHGSRTSSGPAFVAAVHPDVAVMSVGADTVSYTHLTLPTN